MNISLIGWSHLGSPIVKNIRQPCHKEVSRILVNCQKYLVWVKYHPALFFAFLDNGFPSRRKFIKYYFANFVPKGGIQPCSDSKQVLQKSYGIGENPYPFRKLSWRKFPIKGLKWCFCSKTPLTVLPLLRQHIFSKNHISLYISYIYLFNNAKASGCCNIVTNGRTMQTTLNECK